MNFLAACPASSDTVRPPSDQLFGPTGVAVSPDDAALFVTNANSELRYNAGTVSVFDLERIDEAIAAWTGSGRVVPSGCRQDADRRETLVCDEAAFMKAGAGVSFGNFATTIAIQDLANGYARLFIPTRGDPSVTWIDWNGTRLSCSAEVEAEHSCDDVHRLVNVHGDESLAFLPEEPFDAFADSSEEFAVVTDFTTGAVTLIDSPRDGNPIIADVTSGWFLPNASGYVGASGVAVRNSGHGDMVYVGSQYENRIQTFTVGRPINGAPPFLLAGAWLFLDGVGNDAGYSSDTRALAFAEDGNRLYALNRWPPSLQILDTSESNTGVPRDTLVAASDICRVAERLAVIDTGDGDRVYITCFEDGQVYVVDPRGASMVEDILTVGRGAYGITAAPTRRRIYVTNFLEDTVAVIDADAGSSTRNRVVLRLGEPKLP